ncbi:MAG: hypothetical protein COA58_04220 [Bacteroidetes bacterium]|nr:MAG: hypothetical protein COA58_04220 [Bacteroidota bacterium]
MVLLIICSKADAQTSTDLPKYISSKLGIPLVDAFGDTSFQIREGEKNSHKEDMNALEDKVRSELQMFSPSYLFNGKVNQLKKALSITGPRIDLDSAETRSRIKSLLQNNISKSGSLEIEAYSANKVLPYSLNERQYVRIYATPNLSLFGLPFSSDIYYTTEDNSYFNTNSFTLNFDLDKYKQNLKKRGESFLDDKKKDLFALADLDEDVTRYKKDVARQILALEREATLELKHYENEVRNAPEKVNQMGQGYVRNLKDSTYDNLEGKIRDVEETSLAISQEEKRRQVLDSIEQKRALLNEKIKQMRSFITKADTLQSQIKNAKAFTADLISKKTSDLISQGKQEKKGFLSKAKDSIGYSKTLKNILISIDEFSIGLSNPYFSNSTLNGIPVKGLSIKRISNKSDFYSRLTLGNSVSTFNAFDKESRQQNLYGRRIVGTKIGFGQEHFNDLYIVSLSVWDPIKNSEDAAVANSVNGLGYNAVFGRVSLSTEAAYSYYSLRTPTSIVNENQSSMFNSIFAKMSLLAESKWKISPNAKLKLKFDQKNQNFKSLGSPFLRSDFRTIDISSTNSFLKKKIIVSGFYKYFTDNVSALSENTNEMKGFGASAQSNFKKYPNFLVSYTPFEQSNNHQDSLLRTNNKFKSLNAQVSYQKTIDNHFFYSILNYNLAIVEYEESGFTPSNTRIWSFNQIYQNDKFRSSVGLISGRTNPSIDSLSFNAINGSVDWTIKKYKIGGTLQHKYTLADGVLLSQAIFIERNIFKSNSIRITSGYRYLDNIWGVKNTNIFYGAIGFKMNL